jgi:ParB family chromosome partitioning protein
MYRWADSLDAVREAGGAEQVEGLSGPKKQPMAEAAEQSLAGTGWLPAALRTGQPAMSAERQGEAVEDAG